MASGLGLVGPLNLLKKDLTGLNQENCAMIDEIKIYSLPVTIEQLLSNHCLNFTANAFATGEWVPSMNQTCKVKKQLIIINELSKTRKLKGSPHYFFNNGIHNHDDFPYPNVVRAIIDLSKTLEIDPFQATINSMEYGVNLITNFDPNLLLSDLIQHQGISFYPIDRGLGMECRHSQYRIKIYNKSYQFNLPYYVLRIEIHVNTMDYLQSKGIPVWTLGDLLYHSTLIMLGNDLIKKFEEILFYDNLIDDSSLNEKDRLVMSNARIPGWWKKNLPKNELDVFRRRYKTLYEKHAKRKWQDILSPLIKEKIETLLELTPETQALINCIEQSNSNILELYESLPEIYAKFSPSDSSICLPAVSEGGVGDKISFSDTGDIILGRKWGDFDKISDSDTKAINDISKDEKNSLGGWEDEIKGLESFFLNIDLPQEPISLNGWEVITDLELFFESHFGSVKANNGNETYLPDLMRLRVLREILAEDRTKDEKKEHLIEEEWDSF